MKVPKNIFLVGALIFGLVTSTPYIHEYGGNHGYDYGIEAEGQIDAYADLLNRKLIELGLERVASPSIHYENRITITVKTANTKNSKDYESKVIQLQKFGDDKLKEYIHVAGSRRPDKQTVVWELEAYCSGEDSWLLDCRPLFL